MRSLPIFLYALPLLLLAGAPAPGSAYDQVRAYDAKGNLTGVTFANTPEADVSYFYDELDRVVAETSNGRQHAYLFDAAGNRTHTLYEVSNYDFENDWATLDPTTATVGDTAITSSYDNLNRLSEMREGAAPRTTKYFYDLAGNIWNKVLPSSTNTECSYDALGRKSLEKAAGVQHFEYSYLANGAVAQIVEKDPAGTTERTVTNSYDLTSRLTEEQDDTAGAPLKTTEFSYDKNNNRTEKKVTVGAAPATITNYNYATNNLNQLDSVSGAQAITYTYDLSGNRTTRTVANAETDTYTYDFENRLATLTRAGGATANGTHAYTYDYRARRVARDESQAGGSDTALSFSGGTSVQERDAGTGALQATFIRGSDYGGGVGGMLYSLRGGTPSYAYSNHRGDVTTRTDGTNNITWQASYEAFGTRTQETGSTQDRQRGNTKDEDPTGLLNEGFRYRDLEAGVFITRDPAGFIDGPNLYTYARQNPWSSFDPDGLFVVDLAFQAHDSHLFAKGDIDGGEYAFRTGLNVVGGLLSFFTGGSGGPALRGAVMAGRGTAAMGKGMSKSTIKKAATSPAQLVPVPAHLVRNSQNNSGGAASSGRGSSPSPGGGSGGSPGSSHWDPDVLPDGTKIWRNGRGETLDSNGIVRNSNGTAIGRHSPPNTGGSRTQGTRYVGEGEAKVIKETRRVPNTNAAGDPKTIFYTHDKPVKSASEAQKAYNLPSKPTHSVTVDTRNAKPGAAGNVEGGTGIEVMTDRPLPAKNVKPLDD